MKLITRQDSANAAPARWGEVYSKGYFSTHTDKQEKTEKLAALAHPIDPDAVDAIIGNASWTRTTCNECGAEPDEVVEVGQPPDYESWTARLCFECLRAALNLASK